MEFVPQGTPWRPPGPGAPRRASGLVACLAGVLALAAAAASAQAAPREMPDELLVKMQPATSRGRALGLLRAAGAEPVAELPALAMHRVRVPAAARDAVQAALARRPDVAFVEPHRLLPPALVPDDPRFDDQWHHATVDSAAAWSRSLAMGRVVAVLDSGVEGDHPDLQAALLAGWNFYDGNGDTSDVFGHGTSVAGVAAAVTDNGTGVAGVAWGAAILPIRVTGTDGWATTWSIAQGLDYAASRGAHVANLSFGGLAGSQIVIDAARQAVQRGMLVVGSAGNCSCTEPFADTPWLLLVGATTGSDDLASFSSRGDHVDLSAPGQGLQTTLAGGGYGRASGTSFSAPLVAGVAALVGASEPGLTPDEIETRLLETALDRGAAGWDPSFGYGRVDAAAALQAGANSSFHCGLGFEAALLLPPLMALRRRRAARSRRSA